MTQDEALRMALEALETELSIDWGNPDEFDTSAEKMYEAIAAIKKALAQPAQEPVAWRTFDGEGGYDYCCYEDNESYADDWSKRNPNHKGWVDKLYTHPPQRTWVGLTDEKIEHVWRKVEASDFHDCVLPFAKELEAELKKENT